VIPADLAEQIDQIAAERHVSGNRAIIRLIKDGLAEHARRRASFMDLTERFQNSTDPVETEQLRAELMKMTFGE
jgi:hypothetical protein